MYPCLEIIGKRFMRKTISPTCLILSLLAGQVAISGDWYQIVDPSRYGRYNAVAHTPIGWIAVGTQSLIRISMDGREWSSPTGRILIKKSVDGKPVDSILDPAVPLKRSFEDVAAFGGEAVVVGDSGVVVSIGAANKVDAQWLPQAVRLQGVASDGRSLVVVGTAGTVYRSTDGRNWTKVPFPWGGDLKQVISTASEFVVVAGDGRMAVSTDGSNWVERSDDSLLFHELAWNTKGFVAVGHYRRDSGYFHPPRVVARSVDGRNWNVDSFQIASPGDDDSISVFADDTAWYLAHWGGSSNVFASKDGIDWTEVTDYMKGFVSLGVDRGRMLAFHDGTWLGVYNDRYSYNALALGKDLSQWRPATIGLEELPVVASWADDSGWWIVRTSNTGLSSYPTGLARSKDLLHWSDSWISGGFPALADGGIKPRSTATCSGERYVWGWKTLSLLQGGALSSVDSAAFSNGEVEFACGDGRFLAIQALPAYQTFATYRWSDLDPVKVDTGTTAYWPLSLRRFKGKWVGLWGTATSPWRNQKLSWSSDGLDWKDVASWDATFEYWRGGGLLLGNLANNDSVLIASSGQGRFLSSRDGISWDTLAPLGEDHYDRIDWIQGNFVALGGNGNVVLSRDGSSWTTTTVPADHSYDWPLSAGMRGDTLLVGGHESLYFTQAASPTTVQPSTKRNKPNLERHGNLIRVRVEPSEAGPWWLYDLSGRPRLRGSRVEGSPEVQFLVPHSVRGALVFPGKGGTSLLVSP